jgi:hypothetical protein
MLRKGDFDVLKVAHSNVSGWIRELVAKHCDEILAGREEQRQIQNKVWESVIADPSL